MNKKLLATILLGLVIGLVIWAFAMVDLSKWIEMPALMLLGSVSVVIIALIPPCST